MSSEYLQDALDFDLLADVFLTESINASPAELHGQLCGYLASGVHLGLDDWLTMALEFADIDQWQDEASRQAMVALYQSTLTLMQNGEYALVPAIADDDAELSERGVSLSQWSHGFLAGFGLSGRKSNLSEDTRQVLQDFANISSMRTQMQTLEDSNDNEKDLQELVEYVRISAMMLYVEHQDGGVHAVTGTNKTKLH